MYIYKYIYMRTQTHAVVFVPEKVQRSSNSAGFCASDLAGQVISKGPDQVLSELKCHCTGPKRP